MRHRLAVLLSLVVVFLAVSSAVLAPRAAGKDLELTVKVSGDQVTMDYLVAGGQYQRNVTAVALEVSKMHQGPIYVLINDGLEFRVKVSLQRMADHFNNEFSLLGSDLTATVIGTDDLPKVFSNRQATLVVGPGADLPDYYGNPARQWVEKGGLWVGIGEGSAPFMYSHDNTDSPNATLRLDFMSMEFQSGKGMSGTPMAKALDLRYVAPESLFLLTDLKAAGGVSIGYEFDRGQMLATAGIVPMGSGALLVFAGNMAPPPLATGEEVLAWDLMKIVLLNVPWWDGNMRYVTNSTLGSDLRGSLTMDLSGSEYVCCGLISNSDTFSGFRVERTPTRGA